MYISSFECLISFSFNLAKNSEILLITLIIISSGTFRAIRKSYATLLIFANFVKQFLFKDLPILIAHILHSNCLSYDYRKQVTKYLPKGLLTINISACSTTSFVVI